MRCPTCRAQQAWSDECRRCKSDLSLLRRFDESRRWHRDRCLRDLNASRPAQALWHAEQLHRLESSSDASRLLAVCCVVNGDFARAMQLVHASSESGTKTRP
ncbi:MAG: hypothetical protein O3A00_12930 [Planctomycetota bacterium]|nr:hypothetical protein [Planctomycetota bacterium]